MNTWTQEARWWKPLELSLFESPDEGGARSTPRCSSSYSLNSSSSADDDDGGREHRGGYVGKSGSIGGRLRRRLQRLTAEAVAAAVEEKARPSPEDDASAALGEHRVEVEGSGALPGLGAAVDVTPWVTVDVRESLGPDIPACWYNQATAEYHWGSVPPSSSTAERTIGPGGPGSQPRSSVESLEARESLEGPSAKDLSAIAHRADGEAWLRRQDHTALLAKGEVVREIGSTGWRQVRVAHIQVSFTSTESGFKCVGEAGAGDGARNLSSEGDSSETIGYRERARPEDAAKVETTAGLPAEVETREMISQPLSFFHHVETNELRRDIPPTSLLVAWIVYVGVSYWGGG